MWLDMDIDTCRVKTIPPSLQQSVTRVSKHCPLYSFRVDTGNEHCKQCGGN